MANYIFGNVTVSVENPIDQTAQYNLILGSAQTVDRLTIGTDLTEIADLSIANGNLSWTETSGLINAISSEIDFLTSDEYTYLNLNTDRSVGAGFVMSERSRAVVSNEWVAALQNGDINITYEQLLGDDDVFDTVISGIGGDVVLIDYRYDENSALLSVIGSYQGGAIIDFGLLA